MSESLQKAALVLKSLPKSEAARVMSKLDPRDVKSVMQESDKIGRRTEADVLAALNQLSREIEATQIDDDQSRKLLNQRNKSACENQDGSGPFKFLVHLAPNLRTELLRDEHPENIALVIMNLPTDVGSQVLKQLDPAIQISVVRRLCQTEAIDSDQLSELAFNLRMQLQKKLNRIESPNGVKLAAQLLSCSDNETQDSILGYLNQLDPTLVDDIESTMLRFEDLSDFENLDIQILLKNVDTSFWAPALKAASKKVREIVLGNMAQRVAELLSTEIANLHSLDNEIASHAQTQIINVCINLAENGKIKIPTNKRENGRKSGV